MRMRSVYNLLHQKKVITCRLSRNLGFNENEWTEKIIPLVNCAKEKYASGITRQWKWREEQLKGLIAFLDIEKNHIFQALEDDLGRVPLEKSVEWVNVRNQVTYMVKNGKRLMERQKVSGGMLHMANSCYRVPEPYGTAFIMGAWNYPFDLTLGPLCGSIAAGNTAVLKPSELSAASANVIAEKLPKYVDPECFPVIVAGPEGSARLLKERYDIIFYTGGTQIGKIVMKAASEHLTPCILELGGKNPVWVDESAKIDDAVKCIFFGKCINSGQICISPNYILCTAGTKEKLVTSMKKLMKEWYGNDPENSKAYSGKMISSRHYERLANLLEETSGTISIGGKTNPENNFIEPTVVTDVSLDDPLLKEEIFGPILPLVQVNSFEEAINIVKADEKPLASYCFAQDKNIIQQWVENISSGGMCINDTIMQVSVEHLPFGGVGYSGMGAYHGDESFKVFSHYKSVLESKTPQFLLNTRTAPHSANQKNVLAYEKISLM